MPGSASRIISMAERSNRVRNDSLEKTADAGVRYASRGQLMAFSLTLIALTAAIVFFALGNSIAGGAFLGLPVLMLIRSFLARSEDQP